jgi:hypothetical protein
MIGNKVIFYYTKKLVLRNGGMIVNKYRMFFQWLFFILLTLVTTACGAESDVKNNISHNTSDELVNEDEVKVESQIVVAETVTTTINYEEKFAAYLKDKNISLKARDVLFNMQNTLDQPFAIMGKAKLDNYYNYGFRDFEKTHFAVSIIDEGAGFSDRWVLYLERDKFNDLFQTLKNGGNICYCNCSNTNSRLSGWSG